jgi:ketosteroid isomerase-like protein
MSQENVELTYRTFDALNRRDLDAYLALTDEDVEFVPRTSAIEGESVYRGAGLGRCPGRGQSKRQRCRGLAALRRKLLRQIE